MELEEGVYAAEKIVQQRIKKGKKEYLVKWVGCTPDQNTWEPARNIYDKRLIAAFEQSQQKSPVKRGRKPKQVVQQHHQQERQVLPFRGGHPHNRVVSSSSSSSSCSSDEAENNEDSNRDNRSVSASSDNSSSSSSSDEDDEEDDESEEEKKPKNGSKPRGKAKQEPAAKKSASLSNAGTGASGTRSTNSPLKEKSPIRESLKRKAEVIQESGKIGVTITTTPKTSPTAGNGSSSTAFAHDTNSVVEAASNLLSLKHGTPVHAPPPAKVARTVSNASAGSGSGTGKSSRPNRAPTATANSNGNGTAGLQNGHVQQQQEPDALPAEYWMTKQPLADQIVLTDVTVNLTTVTVRECKTQDEFFRSKPLATTTLTDDSKKPQQLQPVTDSKK